MAHVDAVLVTGSGGNGKTTLLALSEKLLRPKFGNNPFVRQDMSQILFRWGIKQPKLEKELTKCLSRSSEGYYVPDALTIETLGLWLDHLKKAVSGKILLLLGGFPRTTLQKVVLDQLFKKWQLVTIDATREQSDTSMIKRFEERRAALKDGMSGQVRVETVLSREVLNRRWDQFTNETLPMIEQAGDEFIKLTRQDLLPVMLEKFFLELKDRTLSNPVIQIQHLERAINRLRAPGHSIHGDIWNVLNPEKENLPTESASQPHPSFSNQTARSVSHGFYSSTSARPTLATAR